MTYDLFHKLLYIRSAHNNEADFLSKLEHMTKEDIYEIYFSVQQQTSQEQLTKRGCRTK